MVRCPRNQELVTWTVNPQLSSSTENYSQKALGNSGEHPEESTDGFTVPPTKTRFFSLKLNSWSPETIYPSINSWC